MAHDLRRAGIAVFLWMASCSAAAAPDFQRVEFHDNKGEANGIAVKLADPDDAAHPTAWEGPLEIVGRCTADLSLITAVYTAKGARYLIATTYNGSTRYAHYVDVTSCKELWPATKASHNFTVAGDNLSAPGESRWQLFLDRAPKQR